MESKKFLSDVTDIKKYWLKQSNNPEEVIDGFIHSLLTYFDGMSSLNDFHTILLCDKEDNNIINSNEFLHEEYHDENSR